jgi:hypothetical protein
LSHEQESWQAEYVIAVHVCNENFAQIGKSLSSVIELSLEAFSDIKKKGLSTEL